MTPEKALKIFNHEVYADGAEKAEANRVIREALGKQIVQKVKRISVSLYGYVGKCPSCNKAVHEDRDKKCCHNCGQKIKWW